MIKMILKDIISNREITVYSELGWDKDECMIFNTKEYNDFLDTIDHHPLTLDGFPIIYSGNGNGTSVLTKNCGKIDS